MSDAPRLDPADLEALDADSWAWLLPHVRRVVADARDDLDPSDSALAELPSGRLAGGRPRRRVAALVAGDPHLSQALGAAIAEAADVPAPVEALLAGSRDVEPDAAKGEADAATTARDRARMRRLRDQLEEARRQVEGARARAVALERQLEAVTEERDRTHTRLEAALAELEEAGRVREQAVERERRRRDQQVARLRDEVRRLRRDLAEADRLAAVRHAAEERRSDPVSSPAHAAAPDAATRVIPGRPSILPDGFEPMTREAAELLMNRGRLVVIDGYNVTLHHQAGLALDQQRRWLVDLAASAARRFGVRPLVVFDGEVAGSGDSAALRRGVRVRFTDAGFTADDDIVLEVEATDEPVLVVTDDAELGRRVRAADADVLPTAPFVWATRQ